MRRGFTLVELMVTIVIVGILAVLVIGGIILGMKGCSGPPHGPPQTDCCPCSSASP
jgi:prepilin-type N-terminal cleavage/methylation domain-containing protein